MEPVSIVLASASTARQAMLRDAGVPVEVVVAGIDERAAQAPLEKADMNAADIAGVLARLKALDVAARVPGALVIGADQVLEFDGKRLNKVRSPAMARSRLLAMSGKTHSLFSAVACARDGRVLWETTDVAHLTMRAFSPRFVGAYLARNGKAALSSVGCYALEGEGVQLFRRIEGDYFTILGMPLLPLLEFLRRQKHLMT